MLEFELLGTNGNRGGNFLTVRALIEILFIIWGDAVAILVSHFETGGWGNLLTRRYDTIKQCEAVIEVLWV